MGGEYRFNVIRQNQKGGVLGSGATETPRLVGMPRRGVPARAERAEAFATQARSARLTFAPLVRGADGPARRPLPNLDVNETAFQPPSMKPDSHEVFSFHQMSRHIAVSIVACTAMFLVSCATSDRAKSVEPTWRQIPLITNGKIDPNWVHTGWGGFVVDDGALRTEPHPKGLGLLVYKKERLGNCQIRVVFKAKDIRSNSGVYVRIADGILDQINNPGAAFERDAAGKPSAESMEKMKASGEREEGPWFAVHRGFEVQIADGGDPAHGTGAIYSLAPRSGAEKKAGEWRTMIITLDGTRIFVDLDGTRVTSFDSASPNLPPRKQWHEPKREPKRPEKGFIGLQNHDPGDVVWFKEVSVRPLPAAGGK